MSDIKIRRYETDGLGYLRAEIQWDETTPVGSIDSSSTTIPNGQTARLSVRQELIYLTISIAPEDVPLGADIVRLPANFGQPFLERLAGATIPSLYYGASYIITPLDDTRFGLAISIGIKGTAGSTSCPATQQATQKQ